MLKALVDHFRCEKPSVEFVGPPSGTGRTGYFRFGPEAVCYARTTAKEIASTAESPLYDASVEVRQEGRRCYLPFDFREAVENLTRERYVADGRARVHGAQSVSWRAYYAVRPLMPVGIRKHLQRRVFAKRANVSFPHWPVDRTADALLERALATAMDAQGAAEVPFIWFWPDGCSSAAILTHDVETSAGVDFCPKLMDFDEEHGIPASFQIIPEGRYPTPKLLLEQMRRRGFEINVHDWNHDGRLYDDRQEFLRRVKLINAYGREIGARGFRAGALYRNLDWYDDLAFDYDMSVPNVARFDPQPGGCCSLLPYFVGELIELPVTATQDYTLFHILGDYALDVWERQFESIMDSHGLISIIVHPDYLRDDRAQQTYLRLLSYLAELRSERDVWIALPGEVQNWWRTRSRLKLVAQGDSWRIEGAGSERARVAFARRTPNGISYDYIKGTHNDPSLVAHVR